MERFAELFDQLAAYETSPNFVHYVTRFMEGLKPAVRVAVGIQQPPDLDTAYQLALLHEELGTISPSTMINSQNARRASALPLPPPPTSSAVQSSVQKGHEERRPVDSYRRTVSEDKWGALRTFCKAKGLCFICVSAGARITYASKKFSSTWCKKWLSSYKIQTSMTLLRVKFSLKYT